MFHCFAWIQFCVDKHLFYLAFAEKLHVGIKIRNSKIDNSCDFLKRGCSISAKTESNSLWELNQNKVVY